MFENNPFRQHRANTEVLKKVNESFKYHIPEDIPANERTAFHGAAADAAKKGKKSFNFGGKTHPVTMKKDTANKIADQKEAVKYPHMMYEPKTGKEVTAKTPMDHAKFAKMGYTHDKPKMKESTMTFREKLMSIFEGDRKAHYKGATEPEGMHDKMKSSKGAMDMVNTPKDVAADGKKVNDDNAAKAAEKKMGKAKKRSGGDNIDKGDTKIVPGGTPVKEPSMAKEEYGMFGKKISNNLLDAVNQVTNEDVSYHKAMKNAHDTHSYAHENEVTNDGHQDHDYAGNEHGEAANHHQKAIDAHKKHGGDSSEYKKAAAAAHKQSETAHNSSKDAGKFKKTAKPGMKFPKKPN